MKRMPLLVIIVLGLAVLAGLGWWWATHSGGGQGGAAGFDFGHTQRTLATGTVAKARILGMRDTGGRFNSNPAIEFQLEVQPVAGPPFVATTRAIISTVELTRFQTGATIAVKYDPADHSSVAVMQ